MEGRGVRNCHVGESALGLVIPANAGIHLLPTSFLLSSQPETDNMDSRFRGNDDGQMDSRFRGNDDGQMDSRGADASAPYSGNDGGGQVADFTATPRGVTAR